MEKKTEARKPHCLILPFPIQGHINPLLQFSKRLAAKGISVTFAATKSLVNSTNDFPSSVRVDAISDGYDQGRGDVETNEYLERFARVGRETLTELMRKLRESGRPVDCVVYDPFVRGGLAVAKSFGALAAAFFTQSCYVNVVYYSVWKGTLKIPVTEKEISFEGLPTLEVSDLPSFVIVGAADIGAEGKAAEASNVKTTAAADEGKAAAVTLVKPVE